MRSGNYINFSWCFLDVLLVISVDNCIQGRSFLLVNRRLVITVSFHRSCEVKAKCEVLPEVVGRYQSAIFSSVPMNDFMLDNSILGKDAGFVQPESIILEHPRLASYFTVVLIDRLQHLKH
jgi:hypothetical protein